MKELKVTFRTVTPLFLAGADQEQAELRLPSIKGALRFWYRAVDPEYRKWEGKIFGSTAPREGQSRFLMRSPLFTWQPIPYSKEFFEGIEYLAFSFILGQEEERKDEYKKRAHLYEENKKFTISFMLRPFKGEKDKDPEDPLLYWRRLMASLWLLGHIGGLGSRSRRGFGTLALDSWSGVGIPEVEQIKKELPIAHREADIKEWANTFSRGIKVIQSWFEGFPDPDHLVIDSNSMFLYSKNNFSSWRKAMNFVGKRIASFRKYKDNKIDRIALGLPMESSKDRSNITDKYCHKDSDRIASPVWIRIIKAGGRYYPVIFILSASFPKVFKRTYKKDGKGELELVGEKEISLDPKAALQKFRHYLTGWEEIK